MKIRIVPYKKGSESAKMIAQGLTVALGYKVWRGPAKPFALNIPWGLHGNKLTSFKAFELKGVSHVPYTTSKENAQAWLKEGATVFARTVSGQSGSGIHIVNPGEVLPDMPLFTKYVPKRKEFRVHVVKGEVIDVQQKKLKKGEKPSKICNHDNHYVFCHEDVIEPAGLRELGIAAVAATGLQFGAVDIIWNETQNRCYVLEVNSAPGLCDTTCQKYVSAFVSKYSQTPPVSTHLHGKVL